MKWCNSCCSLNKIFRWLFLKDSSNTAFLSSRLKLFQSWQVETANDLPPSVNRLNFGQIQFILLYLVTRLCCWLLIMSLKESSLYKGTSPFKHSRTDAVDTTRFIGINFQKIANNICFCYRWNWESSTFIVPRSYKFGMFITFRDLGCLPFDRKIRLGCPKHNGKRFISLPQKCHIRYGLNPKKGQICLAWVRSREGTEKLVNGKQHSVWFVPTGMNGLPRNVLLNFRLEFPKSDLTIYLPSGISEIFLQMVSTPGLTKEWSRRHLYRGQFTFFWLHLW